MTDRLAVKTIRILLVLLVGILLVGCRDNPDVPDEEEKVKYIEGTSLITSEPKAFEKLEFQIFDTSEYKKLELNPFDYREFKIQGRFKSPSEKEYVIPAFWYQDYDIVVNRGWAQNPSGISGMPSTNPDEPQGLEMVNLIGDPHFRLRYLPEEAGTHELTIEVVKNNVVVQTLKQSIEVADNTEKVYKGVISVEEKNKRNFVFENGDTFIPVGQNTAWYTSSTRKTEDFQVWFDKMSENEANFTRIWMATWSFSLHWGSDFKDFTSRFNAAARLDRTIEYAETYDIYYMLTLLNHGQFSAITNAEWIKNPWNKANGGILELPSHFFTNKEAKDIYKQQLLYIIARYGHSSHMMAYELFNEVDWTDQFSSINVHLWHKDMAEFVKDNDPYQRLVTTSYKGQTGSAYQLNSINFTNPHDYSYNNKQITIDLVKTLDRLFNDYNKPVLHSEIGVNWESGVATAGVDPTGISLKQSQWVGIMGGGAGAAMNWWWDSWVHPNDLYYRFEGIGKFAQQLDMTSDTYQLLHKTNNVEVSHNQVSLLGYILDDRIYGYAFDNKWTYRSQASQQKTVNLNIPFKNGTYTLEIYNTDTGEIIDTMDLIINNGKAIFTLTLTDDCAFIIK